MDSHPSSSPLGRGDENMSGATETKGATDTMNPLAELAINAQQPRQSFNGHTLQTPWTDLQLAYFAGCAMWTYLNFPFLLAWPGVASEELSPWKEDGASWRRLAVHFPDSIATHSSKQTLSNIELRQCRGHRYSATVR
jgi:hypothetical protein